MIQHISVGYQIEWNIKKHIIYLVINKAFIGGQVADHEHDSLNIKHCENSGLPLHFWHLKSNYSGFHPSACKVSAM